MKKNMLSSLLFVSLLLAALTACKKDEHKVYFEGGTAPALTASSMDAIVLAKANQDLQAIRFNWTNPDYRFTTGVSSQDVTYILQVDTVGAGFSSPGLQEVSIAKELGIAYTVKDLNSILTKLDLKEDIMHQVAFRIKATLANGTVPVFSNVVELNITPYLDVAVPIPTTGELYITGDGTASGWTNNPPGSQKATQVSNTEYSIVMDFQPGFFYKFLSNLNNWQPQYGGSSATGGDIKYNLGSSSDPDAIPTPAEAGTYKVTLNFKTGKYTVTK